MSLRALLDERAQKAMESGGVADTIIDSCEINLRLASMQRALVAHQALSRLLSISGTDGVPDSLRECIALAVREKLINDKEERWLKHFNDEANKAKLSSFAILRDIG